MRRLPKLTLAAVASGLVLAGMTAWHLHSGRSAIADTEFIAQLKHIPICNIAIRYDVPAELLAGVILAENALHRDWKDTAQDTIFRYLVEHRDQTWWSEWAKQAMLLADRSEEEHVALKKWPLEVTSSGIVMSIGPAQLTPRTTIKACSVANPPSKHCASGPKALVEAMLDEVAATELAAMILNYENKSHLEATGMDVSCQIDVWSTLYNYGGRSYRNSSRTRAGLVNDFGNWVSVRSSTIKGLLACERPAGQPCAVR